MDIHIRQDIRAGHRAMEQPHRHHHNRRHLDGARRTRHVRGRPASSSMYVQWCWPRGLDAVWPFSATNGEDSADLARDLLADDRPGRWLASLS